RSDVWRILSDQHIIGRHWQRLMAFVAPFDSGHEPLPVPPDYVLVRQDPPYIAAGNQVVLPEPVRPRIADDGSVVVHVTDQSGQTIRLYRSDLTGFKTIASSADFQDLGLAPGLAGQNAEIVAFYGDLTAAGADRLSAVNSGLLVSGRAGGTLPGLATTTLVDPDANFETDLAGFWIFLTDNT